MKSYRVQAVEYDLAEALIRSGRLSEDSAQTRLALEQAVEAILRQFVCDWVRDRYRSEAGESADETLLQRGSVATRQSCKRTCCASADLRPRWLMFFPAI